MIQQPRLPWTDPQDRSGGSGPSFERVRRLDGGLGLGRALLRCACCGRLRAWEDHEDGGGRDRDGFETLVPVRDGADLARFMAEPRGRVRLAPRRRRDLAGGRPPRTGRFGDPAAALARDGGP